MYEFELRFIPSFSNTKEGAPHYIESRAGKAAWAPDVDGLRKHFNGAEARWFPSLRAERATSWACGEDNV